MGGRLAGKARHGFRHPVPELDGRRLGDHPHRGVDYPSGTPLAQADCHCMGTLRSEIEQELRHLRNLERQLTDQKTLDGIKALIADLEAEKAKLDSNEDE